MEERIKFMPHKKLIVLSLHEQTIMGTIFVEKSNGELERKRNS
jgi:hypothetical protein